jgi:hypothetical protein
MPMANPTKRNGKADPAILKRALLLACERIADSPQSYEEANTPDGWFEEFTKRAESDQVPQTVPVP